MNSDDEQRLTSEHKKCESQSTKVTYIHTSKHIYDIYNNISLIFVLSLIVSRSLPIIITTVELCVCVFVCVCMT